jgi:catechol 2,3-dioxygenase-like lactoylglutathione lyase family enzyme
MRVCAILHASLVVSDLARSRVFYEELLGLTQNHTRPQMPFEGIWYDAGPNQQIHLMQLPNPEAGLQRPAHGGRDRHVALAVDDIEALRLELENSGINYTRSQSGRPVIFCRDPDDNALEFIQVK